MRLLTAQTLAVHEIIGLSPADARIAAFCYPTDLLIGRGIAAFCYPTELLIGRDFAYHLTAKRPLKPSRTPTRKNNVVNQPADLDIRCAWKVRRLTMSLSPPAWLQQVQPTTCIA